MRIIILALLLCLIHNNAAMTEKQMKAALKLVRNTCQPKNKATDEQIDAMHKGDWNQDKNGQCYMHCILSMYKLMKKDNTFDWEGGIKTVEAQAPPSMAPAAIASIKNCKDAIKTPDDKCVAGFEVAKCLYFDNPEKYFLP